MFKVRRFVVVVIVYGKIFVVGGYSDLLVILNIEVFCEMFDFSINEWSLVVSFVFLRVVCGIVSMGDIIYLFGGRNEEYVLKIVMRFDVQRNEWYEVVVMLNSYQCLYIKALLLKLFRKFSNDVLMCEY